MATRCPKCNHLNPQEATRCQVCNSSLTQVCPRCGAPRPLGVAYCPACESGADDADAFLQMFQETPRQAIRGRYVVVRVLSRGRVDTVYRVRDRLAEDATFALKEWSEIALLTGEEKRRARQSFQERSTRWRSLHHPNLVRILDIFSLGDRHYMLMPLISGWNLAQLIRSTSLELEESAACNWGAQLCDLLSYLHKQDPPIILGRLEPEQVMVTREGLVQLVGFNLTRLFLPEREGDLHFAPLSAYMAPEIQGGAYTPAADIYAVGMLLYAMVARQLLSPSSRRPESLHRAIPGLSRRLEAAIMRATRRDPEARFATAADLREMLWGHEPLTPRPLATATSRAPAESRPRATSSGPAMAQASPMPAPAIVQAVAPKPSAAARLVVRPRRLAIPSLGLNQRQEFELTVYNSGEGELEGRLVSQVEWIALGVSAFRLGPKRAARIPATIWGARLPRGATMDPQAILVDSNGGRQWITVEAQVAVEPLLNLAEESLDFGTVQGPKEASRHLTISNAGGGVLDGRVSSRVPWLHVPHPDFHCVPQRPVQVEVVFRPKLLSPGEYREVGALTVDSDAGQVQVEVRVAKSQPLLAVSPLLLDFGELLSGEQVERPLIIANRGTGNLDCRLQGRESWILVSPQPMRLSAGEEYQTMVAVDIAHLKEGSNESAQALAVESNAGTARVAAKARLLAPRLFLEQDRLELGEVRLGEVAEGWLRLRNAGTAPLHCRLETGQEWLKTSPAVATVAPQDGLEVKVEADTSRFAQGQVVEVAKALWVISDGGECTLALHLVALMPALEVTPPRLDFGIVERLTPAMQTLLIRNRDTGLLEWEIESDAPWVEIIPRQGHCRGGEEREVTLVAYGLALPPDQASATGTVRIRSNGGERLVPLAMTIASPRLYVDISRIDLGMSVNYAEVEGSFLIWNHGLGPLRGSVLSRSERLSVEPAAFQCDTGAAQVVRVRARSEGLLEGHVEEPGAIMVESNGGRAMLDIAYGVLLEPRLKVTLPPLTLAEDGTALQGRLVIENVGQKVAQVNIVLGSDKLEITRRSNTIKPGKAARLQVTLRQAASVSTDELCIQITSQNESLHIPVEIEPPKSS